MSHYEPEPCVGCMAEGSPLEWCPQHGRPYSYWVEGVETLAARLTAVKALHSSRDPGEEDAQCVGCLQVDPGAFAPWPCPTVLAARGVEA